MEREDLAHDFTGHFGFGRSGHIKLVLIEVIAKTQGMDFFR